MASEADQKIIDGVEKYGWFAQSVAPRSDSDDPQEWFTYTIGLTKTHGWPEIICFGLGSDVAYGLLADAIAECETRAICPSDGLVLTDTIKGYDALLVNGAAIPESYFGTGTWYARRVGTEAPPARLQLLWPDSAGKFPNDPACSEGVRRSQTPVGGTE